MRYEVPPSSANLYEPVPPTFVAPSPTLQDPATVLAKPPFIYVFRSIEIKYVEQRVIVEHVDRCMATAGNVTSYSLAGSRDSKHDASRKHTSESQSDWR
jgi:hypothetical protein